MIFYKTYISRIPFRVFIIVGMEMIMFLLLTSGPLIWAALLMAPKSWANHNPDRVWRIAMTGALLALGSGICAAAALLWNPIHELRLPAAEKVVLYVDALSTLMGMLIGFLGWVILRFSRNYLDGNPRQGLFFQWLGATLASVFILVLAGHMLLLLAAWIATSLSLHHLLAFNSERPAALISARKKFVFSRIADVCLISSAYLLYQHFQTLELPQLLNLAKSTTYSDLTGSDQLAILLLAIGAMLKSAQFPFHTWLPDTLETPTPVSALMHAGIISAGGFLMIRLSPVIALSPLTLRTLVVVGAITAIFGSLVMLTQTSIKKSLAFSTVSQMGYMMLQCGLGAFGLATLHLVAHSLYKAHTFLSSGATIEQEAPIPLAHGRISGSDSPTSVKLAPILIILSVSLGVTFLIGTLFGISIKNEPSLLTLGAVLVFAVATLITQTAQAQSRLIAQAVSWGLLTSVAYFSLHHGMNTILSGVVPNPQMPFSTIDLSIQSGVLLAFAAVFILQIQLSSWQNLPWAQKLYVLVLNRFYVNAFVNRLLTRIWPVPSQSNPSGS